MQEKILKLILSFSLVLVTILMLGGCGSSQEVTRSNGQNCVECHTSRDNILADLKANPLEKKEKSSETSGEG